MKIKTGLGLYKIYNFLFHNIKVIFEPIISVIHSILCYNFIRLFKSKAFPNFKKKVYVIGSGQSVDDIDISKIKDSTVILLNNSWQLYKKFHISNQVFTSMGDVVGTINRIAKDLPADIPKLMVLAQLGFNLSSYKFFLNFNKKKDYFFICDMHNYFYKKKRGYAYKSNSNANIFGLYTSTFCSLKKYNEVENIWIGPYTGMFTYVMLAYRLGAKEIYSCGFDATNYNLQLYSRQINLDRYLEKYKSINHEKFNQRRRLVKINLWSQHVSNYLKKNGITWINISNKTLVNTVKKIDPLDFKY